MIRTAPMAIPAFAPVLRPPPDDPLPFEFWEPVLPLPELPELPVAEDDLLELVPVPEDRDVVVPVPSEPA